VGAPMPQEHREIVAPLTNSQRRTHLDDCGTMTCECC
jgi:hypothetical protein